MIPILMALAAAQAAPAPAQSDEALFRTCASLVKSAPDEAVAKANDWLVHGGGVYARQCLGLAYVELGRWSAAATVYDQAAREAETQQSPFRSDLWVQAGNAWLAAGDGAKAREAFNAALATTLLTPELRGEVLLDRARAAVPMGDLASARTDIDKALELVPGDGFGWYLSAALAVKEKNLKRAQNDIARAVSLAPDDPDVLLEAGNIAGLSGETEAAEGLYARVVRIAPASKAGKAAEAALAVNGAAPDGKPQPR